MFFWGSFQKAKSLSVSVIRKGVPEDWEKQRRMFGMM
jgi:hypothetical protein